MPVCMHVYMNASLIIKFTPNRGRFYINGKIC